MINPDRITNFNRTDPELEEFLLFCVVVAGKSAYQQSQKLHAFLKQDRVGSPFAHVRCLISFDQLRRELEAVRMGQYNRIVRAFSNIVHSGINLRRCAVQDLDQIHGIGPKSARFFLMHSRRNQRIATLDTHILAWLRDLGYSAPKATPSSMRKYYELESIFLKECDSRGMSPAKLDLEIWKSRSRKIAA